MELPWWLPFGPVPEISAADLARALDASEDLYLLDVRTEAEFARGHIRGAVSAPIAGLSTRLSSLELDAKTKVVAICLTAHRSIPAVRVLRRGGIAAVQLAGGMLAWRAARLPEERG